MLKHQWAVNVYDNGATEIICLTDGVKKTVYNTGDVVYSIGNEIVYVIPRNGRHWMKDNTWSKLSSILNLTITNGMLYGSAVR
jgi:hypothetical protein